MEFLTERPCSLDCSYALPSDLFDDLSDSGYSTAVTTPETEILPVDATSLSDLLSSFVNPEESLNLRLKSGELPHYKESANLFFIDAVLCSSLWNLDLTSLDCYVTSPCGMQYPVHLQPSADFTQIVCSYRPLECGQHTAFLFRGHQLQSSLPILVHRNYSDLRPRPVVSVDIEVDESTNGLQVRKPWGFACNINTEQLAIADRERHEVLVYGPDGDLNFSFGSFGTGPGQFSRPISVAFDSVGNRYFVADKDNHRVQIFSSSGVFLSSFGQRGRRAGHFSYPWGVAVSKDGRFVVVADSRNGRIQLFDSNGRFLRQYGGELKYPRGVTFDNSGEHILVSDFNLHSIFKLDINFHGCSLLVNDSALKRPSGLEVDISGNLLVCDSRNNSIKVFDSTTGILLHNIKGIGSHPLELPLDLTVMRAGFIAVLDLNGRVRVF